ARRAPLFLKSALDGWEGDFRWVRHHVAHAASATFASGFDPCSVLVLDGRGEVASHLAGRFADGRLDVLAAQRLPHSLGLLYEELTAHLGFRRSSDEYKVMAMSSYAEPEFLDDFRRLVRADAAGGFAVDPVDLALGAALHVAAELGDRIAPMRTAALGSGFGDAALERALDTAAVGFERPDDVADAVAEVLADNGVVAWFQGRSEFGPRALGHRSL